MSNCPCCGNALLRHVRHNDVYWFCQSCWAEMPNLDLMQIINARRQLRQPVTSGGERKELVEVGCS